jgi:hypothetical protein
MRATRALATAMKKAFRKQFKGVEGVVTIDELFDIKQKGIDVAIRQIRSRCHSELSEYEEYFL